MDLAPRLPRLIVALHGFTGSGQDFEALWHHLPLPPDLSPWAPDLVGHTPTPPTDPAAYRIEAEADRLAATLPEAAEAVVLGYSMGGRLALHLAARHPARVRALVLVGASPGLAAEAERQARRAADAALASRLLAGPVEAFLQMWEQTPIIASQSRIAEPWRGRQQARKQRLQAHGLALSLQEMGTGAMPSLWGRLPPVPMLLLTGAEDEKFTAIAARMAAEAGPRAAAVVLPGAGHCAHLEQPALAAEEIKRFFSQLGVM